MALKDEGARFGAISIINHWTIAVLIIVMLAIGLYMDSLPRGPGRGEWIDLHKSIGIMVQSTRRYLRRRAKRIRIEDSS